MDATQNYLSMFFFLDAFYFQNRDDHPEEVDDLGGFLGAMDPFLFAGGLPMDRAVLEDWNSLTRGQPAAISAISGFNNMFQFVIAQEKEFGFDLSFVLDFLRQVEPGNDDDPHWRQWLE
jgi:hypothetical protein